MNEAVKVPRAPDPRKAVLTRFVQAHVGRRVQVRERNQYGTEGKTFEGVLAGYGPVHNGTTRDAVVLRRDDMYRGFTFVIPAAIVAAIAVVPRGGEG